MQMGFFFLPPQSDIKQTRWNVNAAWPLCSGLRPGLLQHTAMGPGGTTSPLGDPRASRLHYFCAGSVERKLMEFFAEGCVFPAVINLHFELKMRLRLRGKFAFFFMPHQMFQYLLYTLDSLWSQKTIWRRDETVLVYEDTKSKQQHVSDTLAHRCYSFFTLAVSVIWLVK